MTRPISPDDMPPGWGYGVYNDTEVWFKGERIVVVRTRGGWTAIHKNNEGLPEEHVFPTACAAAVFLELNRGQ